MGRKISPSEQKARSKCQSLLFGKVCWSACRDDQLAYETGPNRGAKGGYSLLICGLTFEWITVLGFRLCHAYVKLKGSNSRMFSLNDVWARIQTLITTNFLHQSAIKYNNLSIRIIVSLNIAAIVDSLCMPTRSSSSELDTPKFSLDVGMGYLVCTTTLYLGN
ncbi:hypothetical protein QCA50_020251 [Cerrena zonata]|uniref:Uncharacterized protein n=1 Tax=Cerrena zonata TaxID=2478898 RepID=A0AAW0F9C8_9APHY